MFQMTQQAVQNTKYAMDGFSIGVVTAWFIGFIGPLATCVTIVWLGMQIVMNWSKFKEAIRGIRQKNDRRHGD